ncbi:hypothetical protein MVEN_00690500 [Mycena venus]|uniref:Uncharacterized protein n=1 Tax=Mycena venus TaxID=2733690 RepID=A0A8H7D2H4_9AGAR|nr:hypothetical protein MVEN_00690500 [Mycena venus]
MTEDGATTAMLDEEAPMNSPKTGHPMPRKALGLLSLILHPTLVVIHLALLFIWMRGLEHRLIFSLKTQRIAAFLITAIATTFGTIYSALLVFVTQILSVRRNLRMNQTLTATHDTAAAWAGIGSAVSQIWSQKAVTASISGVLSAFLYLGNILVLHITTPALFSLETFNSSRPVHVTTQGLPAYNWSADVLGDIRNSQSIYAPQSLYFLPSIVGSTTMLGLHGGTLYDVLESNAGIGNVTVNATGFNVTCGFVPDAVPRIEKAEFSPAWEVQWDGSPGSPAAFASISPDDTGNDTVVAMQMGFLDSVFFYYTIPIIDSNGDNGGPSYQNPYNMTGIGITPSIRILGCSQSPVTQTAVVDAQSNKLLTVEPAIRKTTSAWLPYKGPATTSPGLQKTAGGAWLPYNPATTYPINSTTGNLYIDFWGEWYGYMPPSYQKMLSAGDVFLNQNLNLLSSDANSKPRNVTLHELENSLSILVASMFWTLGHIQPAGWNASNNSLVTGTTDVASNAPFLLQGGATVIEYLTQVRLDLSIIAVGAGLAVSTALMFLALPSSLFHREAKREKDVLIDGTGILHAIWLYRNHPDLETHLEQVEHPTDENLRKAGIVRIRLV